MAHKHGKIIVHRADLYSETDASVSSSDDAEIAEIAENANFKYSKKLGTSRSHQKRTEHRQKRLTMATPRLTADSRQSSSSSLASSQDLPILRLLAPDRSAPLHRSHYSTSPRNEGFKDLPKDFYEERRSSFSSTEDLNNRAHRRPGFRALTSRSNTPDLVNHSRHQRRSQSIPDVKATLSSAMVPIGLCEFIGEEGSDATIGGIQKLLKSLNIAERLRQQKAEQERLNLYNLPPQMKQQLKNIYVY